LSAFLIELTPQEAYYWNYALHPALSYFDHPPVVAWLIKAGAVVLGKSELGVRAGGLVLNLLSTWLLYALGELWFGRKAGLWAAFLFQALPLYFVYGVLTTPDAPLVFFWLLTLYLISIAVCEDRPWVWYLAGATLGLCLLSKYSAAFLVPCAFLFLISHPRYRRWLLRKEPYRALLIAFVVFGPVILWNVENDWASFDFQVADRLSQGTSQPLRRFGEFLLIQLGVTYPVILAALLLASAAPISLSWRQRRVKWRFCFLFSIPLLAFLLLYSFHSLVKANWPLPGYLSLLIAAYPSYRYLRLAAGARMKRMAGSFLSASFYALPVIYVVFLYHSTVTIPYVPAHTWTTGWNESGRVVGREAKAFEAEGGKKVFLLGMDTHYIAAALSFYADDAFEVFSRNLVGRRARAFDYWTKTEPVGLNALVVDLSPPDLEALREHFSRVEEDVRRIPVMKGDRTLRYLYLVRCFNYDGRRS
jgi:dolichol-phosphate mannosyltransferase